MTVTSPRPAEIQHLIEGRVNGFNTHDNALFRSVFGEAAVIIDGICAVSWLTNAQANWLADVEKWREMLTWRKRARSPRAQDAPRRHIVGRRRSQKAAVQ